MVCFLKLNNWVESLINERKLSLGHSWEILPMQGDASCRQYFRLESTGFCSIIVVSPQERIDNNIFISIAKSWKRQGINVPEVFHVDEKNGYMMLEDFGSVHLYDCSKPSINMERYRQAIRQLHKIQAASTQGLVVFDQRFLQRELQIFDTWMVQHQLALVKPSLLDNVYALLIQNSLEQPQVTMHRDFHSRNLLISDQGLGVIDFQDAVCGPLAYDLVSLLKDCYLRLSDEQINLLINEYLRVLNHSELLQQPIAKSDFVRWFDLIGLQRHLKVLGLFIRLAMDEGKKSYLADIPRVLNYVLKVSKKYPELREFDRWLTQTMMPVVHKQSWYQR